MSITFNVSSEVSLGEPLKPIAREAALASSLQGNIEALWPLERPLVTHGEDHALLDAVHHAFYQHFPLTLSPDAIWLTLARGFALHVNLHADELRSRFVAHAGKERLTVRRPDFLPGRQNPWPEVFAAFGDQVGQRVGKLRDFLACNFSTTGPTERAASELMVMDTFQAYFEYIMMGGCGIPRVTLTGTPEDWRSVRNRAALFAEYGLEEWSHALDPVLAQFVAASERNADVDFWRSLFRYHSGSGPAVMTGWIVTFFPYIRDLLSEELVPNPCLRDWRERLEIDEQQHWREQWENPQGFGMRVVPPCLTSVPLTVFWGRREAKYQLVGGLMGVSQCPRTLAVSAEAGWAVVE